MTITLTAFRWVPAFAQGYVRDLRVRWALEEAGLPYEVTLVDGPMLRSAEFLHWQPFAQVPAYRDDTVEMFESGAIVLHIAARSEALAPADPAGRARVTTWVLAALNSIEPHTQTLLHLAADLTPDRRAQAERMVDARLAALANSLAEQDYLERRFTAGDLIMTTVLRELVDCGVLARHPTLDAYRRRCEARPAFARAMEGQMRTFRENASA